ncbi:MAG TPA: ABC transporter substrate-binding protein [Chloroflexota bacterium]|nr:ABC transporter substrate-binding protein [Chloroflexota bacterium]
MRWASVLAPILACGLAACSGAAAGPAAPGAAPGTPSPAPSSTNAPASPAPSGQPLQHVSIGAPGPSLSYLPAYLASKLGYFQEEGLDPEFVQITGPAAIAAVINGELDFTTLLSAIGANALQGGPTRIVQFHSVKLQHVVSAPPTITAISQLAGKRIGVDSLGTLTAFETRKLADKFQIPDLAIVAAGNELERIAAMQSGAIDASIESIPANLVAEREGFPTLLRIGTVLDIPQAGFGTSQDTLRDKAPLVSGSLRAAARALPVIANQRDTVVQVIAEFVSLEPGDAQKAYDQVVDTYSPNGLPTDAQLAAYADLLEETAGAPPGAQPDQMVDFTIARRVAADLGLPSQ